MAIVNSAVNRNVIMGFDHSADSIGKTQTGTIQTSKGDLKITYEHKQHDDLSCYNNRVGEFLPHKLSCELQDRTVAIRYNDQMARDDLHIFATAVSFLNEVAAKLYWSDFK